MEYVIAIGAILTAIAAFFFNSAQKAKVDAELAQTKAKDQALQEQQSATQSAIATLDVKIAEAKVQQAVEERKAAEDNMSLKERADRLRKGIQ